MAIRFFSRLAVCHERRVAPDAPPYVWMSPWQNDFRGELGLRRRFVVIGR
jgi:hypothetical protein